MIPVEGDSSAASQLSAGSSARAASPESVCMSPTPLASAWVRINCSFSASCAVLVAIAIKRLLAADAHPRHPASGRVVDTGMDHLAVARGGHGADALGLFQDDHFAPGERQSAGDRKTDHTGPDNDAIDLVHGDSNPGNLPRHRHQPRLLVVVLLTDAVDQPVGLSRNMLAAISR